MDTISWADFAAQNVGYLEELWQRLQTDPEVLNPEDRHLLAVLGPPPAGPPAGADRQAGQDVGARSPDAALLAGAAGLARAIRTYGHRAAQLDPLGAAPPGDDALAAEAHGVGDADLARLPAGIIGGPAAGGATSALDAINRLRAVYQGTTGYEFEHVSNAEERTWLHEAVVAGRFRPPQDPIDERRLLARLTEVGSFERFLQRAFPGQTRFSLEGLGMLVPMLDEIIGAAAEAGCRAVLLGTPHRGRLNVLAHVLGKPYEAIIGEFLGRYQPPNTSASGSSQPGWTGDVKYHLGARRAYHGGEQVAMAVMLAPNPSHLEFVDPVVQGMTRAYGERRDQPGPPRQDEQGSLAILVHGDASFPGEGIVAECLNLSRLPGYRTGGTIHLIANNQLGFTAEAASTRSTLYASDLAKGFEMPVIHVNADDAEACIAAARLAQAYRERFRKDVVLDLVGYRRYGHNEGDEPSFTQPLMYAAISRHATVRELWVRQLVARGAIKDEDAQAMLQTAVERLHGIRRRLLESPEGAQADGAAGLDAGGPAGGLGHPAAPIVTRVAPPRLAALNERLYAVPEGFHLHPKLMSPFEKRRLVFASTNGRVEWAHAEALALASILVDGVPVRLTGQDTARGAFSQRHLALHDVQTGAVHVALQALPAARASFEMWDSPLSEAATLGFEFGYDVTAPEALVLWEAQYGDFVNAAQVIIDQFIASARSKWGQLPKLVLLLPHGYEGQGPDHSSAHLERFLQLAAEDNLRIANCSTAAQYFHILRRQAALLGRDPRPLVLLTPKSLLRHPLAASPPAELSSGSFRPVIDDEVATRGSVRRLVLCSGKVYVDLAATGRLPVEGLAVARVEELYPFPAGEIAELLAGYPGLREVVWLQEEPRDMGAWTFVAPRLRDLLAGRLPLLFIGRPRRASSAEGAHEWHLAEQRRIVEAAFDLRSGERDEPARATGGGAAHGSRRAARHGG
ncbi:MAG: 2-oxoglutarate dehydrogenase E1 component [Chloroflexota bacterium]